MRIYICIYVTFFFYFYIISNFDLDLQHVPCKFFRNGTCTAGENCPFSHSLETERPICKYFLKGNCKFGPKCALSHALPGNTNLPNGTSTNTMASMAANGGASSVASKQMGANQISPSLSSKTMKNPADKANNTTATDVRGNTATSPYFPFSRSPGRHSGNSTINGMMTTPNFLSSGVNSRSVDEFNNSSSGFPSSLNGIPIASPPLATSPTSFSLASSASSTNLGGSKGLLFQQMTSENNRDYFSRRPTLLNTYGNRCSSTDTLSSLSRLTSQDPLKASLPLQSPPLAPKTGVSLSRPRLTLDQSLGNLSLGSGINQRRQVPRSNSYAGAFPSVVSASLPTKVDLNHQMDVSDEEQRFLSTPLGSFDESILGSSPINRLSSSFKQYTSSLKSPGLSTRTSSTMNSLNSSRFGAYFSKSRYVEGSGSMSTTPLATSVNNSYKLPSGFSVREEAVFSSPTTEGSRPVSLARLKSEPIFRSDTASPETIAGLGDTKNDPVVSTNNSVSRITVANSSPPWNSTVEEETPFQMDD